jgi:hypothetical protein
MIAKNYMKYAIDAPTLTKLAMGFPNRIRHAVRLAVKNSNRSSKF